MIAVAIDEKREHLDHPARRRPARNRGCAKPYQQQAQKQSAHGKTNNPRARRIQG